MMKKPNINVYILYITFHSHIFASSNIVHHRQKGKNLHITYRLHIHRSSKTSSNYQFGIFVATYENLFFTTLFLISFLKCVVCLTSTV